MESATLGAVLLKLLPRSCARLVAKLGVIGSISTFLRVASMTTEEVSEKSEVKYRKIEEISMSLMRFNCIIYLLKKQVYFKTEYLSDSATE